ncbi:MAG TPA: BTAD domain-containing putative transcriptional regulator [Nocardioidaceae bacterium]|nr:BTAD domain-containing putative transcriptional regulator [Nocardioidaceae bacterium]
MPGAHLDLRVLGPFEVHGPEGQLTIRSGMQRRLLAALVVQLGSVVSVDRLIDVLWEGSPPRTAPTSLRTYVARLREGLRTIAPVEAPITTRRPGYLLDVEPGALDAHRFEVAVRQAHETMLVDPVAAADALRRALGWWHGRAFAEFADAEFARREAARLEDLRVVAREIRTEALLESGDVAEAVVAAETLVVEQPLRERARAVLMAALAQAGRSRDAIDLFRSYERMLREDFGLDPSDRLRTLHQRILAERTGTADG